MTMAKGTLTLAHYHGAPIRVHWSVPIAALVFSRFRFAPAFWAGFFGLIVIHELGHALLVRRFGLTLHSITVHGLGGSCSYSGMPSRRQGALIAWGGVWAQALLLGTTLATWTFLGPFSGVHAAELYGVLVYTNLLIIGLNLIPLEPLDGAQAWPLLGMLGRDVKRRSRARRHAGQVKRSVSDELREFDAATQDPERLKEADKAIQDILRDVDRADSKSTD